MSADTTEDGIDLTELGGRSESASLPPPFVEDDDGVSVASSYVSAQESLQNANATGSETPSAVQSKKAWFEGVTMTMVTLVTLVLAITFGVGAWIGQNRGNQMTSVGLLYEQYGICMDNEDIKETPKCQQVITESLRTLGVKQSALRKRSDAHVIEQQDDKLLEAGAWIADQLEHYHLIFQVLEELQYRPSGFLDQRDYSRGLYRKAFRTFLSLSSSESQPKLQSVADFVSEVDSFYANVSRVCGEFFAYESEASHQTDVLFARHLLEASLNTLAQNRVIRPIVDDDTTSSPQPSKIANLYRLGKALFSNRVARYLVYGAMVCIASTAWYFWRGHAEETDNGLFPKVEVHDGPPIYIVTALAFLPMVALPSLVRANLSQSKDSYYWALPPFLAGAAVPFRIFMRSATTLISKNERQKVMVMVSAPVSFATIFTHVVMWAKGLVSIKEAGIEALAFASSVALFIILEGGDIYSGYRPAIPLVILLGAVFFCVTSLGPALSVHLAMEIYWLVLCLGMIRGVSVLVYGITYLEVLGLVLCFVVIFLVESY